MERDHLMITCLRLCIASMSARRRGISPLPNSTRVTFVQHWETFLVAQKSEILDNWTENMDEHDDTSKSGFNFDKSQAIGHAPKY